MRSAPEIEADSRGPSGRSRPPPRPCRLGVHRGGAHDTAQPWPLRVTARARAARYMLARPVSGHPHLPRRHLARAIVVCLALVAPASAAAAPPGAGIPRPHPSCPARPRTSVRRSLPAHGSIRPASYTRGFDITASKVTLDCRGAVIDATGRGGGSGIEVRAPADADLSRVTIRNCVVRGFLNSIRVTREGFRALRRGPRVRPRHTRRAHRAHRGVGLQRSRHLRRRLRDAHHDPPLHDHRAPGSSGIYLEAGSADNVVTSNSIRDNGFRENGPGGSIFTFAGARFRFWGIGREGISIDGSRRNLVAGNSFEGNSAGGIFLYTNCGEYVNSRPERWFQRRYGADDNMIVANRFEGGVNGVWVGSRMGESTLADGVQRSHLRQAGHHLDHARPGRAQQDPRQQLPRRHLRGARRGRPHEGDGQPASAGPTRPTTPW